DDKDCKFHLRLVRTRWFKDEIQDMSNIDRFIDKHTFLIANCYDVGSEAEQRPSKSYMDGVRKLISEESSIPRKSLTEGQKKRQYGEMMGVAKSTISLAQNDQDSTTRVDFMEAVEGVMRKRQRRLELAEGLSSKEIDEVRDPLVGKKVGRPRSSRKKASYERTASKKKSKGKKSDKSSTSGKSSKSDESSKKK
ncbi:hypothetical protein BGZ75_002246, partial [Mortierella antarctica]